MTAQRLVATVLATAGLPVALLALWWVASAGSGNPFFPPLARILAASPDVWNLATLREAVLPSLLRLGAGFVIASVAGVVIGTVVGLCRRTGYALTPVLEFFRAIPPPVLAPALILVLGIDDTMRIALIVAGCIWPVLLNTVDGVRSVDSVLADTARSQRLSTAGRLRHVILPWAAPRIAAGMYQALGIGVVLMVVSEMFAASKGIGASIVRFQQSFAVAQMWSGVLMLGVIGVVLSVGFRAVEARVLRWHIASHAVAGQR